MRTPILGLCGALALCLSYGASPAPGAEIYTTALTITAEDLIAATEAGREVKALNEKMRSVAEGAKKVEPGSHAYNLLKQEFENLKRERDGAGENLRGLRGKELIFYGNRANADSYDFKQRFIRRWEKDPRVREAYGAGTLHVSYDKKGNQRVATTPPRPEDVDSYVAGPTPRGPQQGKTPVSGSGIVVVPTAGCRWEWADGSLLGFGGGQQYRVCQCNDARGKPYLGKDSQCPR